MKRIFILSLSLFLCYNAHAQRDTTIYCMMTKRELAVSKNTANYFLFVMPPDSSSGKKLYPVSEYYPTGIPKLVVMSETIKYDSLVYEGPSIEFYPDGKKKIIANYTDGFLKGNKALYYPNGQPYAVETYNQKEQLMLIDCRDSTGNTLAENGNGNWLWFDDDMKNLIEEGPIKDSLAEGDWHETNKGKNYITSIHKGAVVSSTDSSVTVGEKVPMELDEEPEYKDGIRGFYRALSRNLIYPVFERDHNITGKVLVSFIVEKDGSLDSFKVLKAPDTGLSDEAVRAVKLTSPWLPGIQNNRPVAVQFTVPISFDIGGDR